MNILFNACSAATFTRTSRRAAKSSIGVFSALSWRTCVGFTATAKVDSDLFFKQICVRCYSSKKSRGESSSSQKSDLTPQMKEDRDGFFVVRKGNLVGVYKNLSDCQTQVGSSICDPPVSVYKGYAMPKDTEDYLLSCGLKNALYSIRAADLTEDLFGTLVPCPFQQPSSSKGGMPEHMTKKRSQDVMWSEYADVAVISNDDSLTKHVKLDDHKGVQAPLSGQSCTLEFDGASKGNPGLAGAGAILRADDGSFAKQLKDRFLSFRIIHVLRESNSDADAQANIAVELADGQIQEEIEK